MRMMTPEEFYPDFPEWPKRWMGVREDLPYGQALLELLRPFVAHLIAKGLARKTLRRHMDNLWLLGGEIIRDVSMNEDHDEMAPEDKLRESVDSDGGPYCRHLDSEEDERSYNATCKALHRFLESSSPQA